MVDLCFGEKEDTNPDRLQLSCWWVCERVELGSSWHCAHTLPGVWLSECEEGSCSGAWILVWLMAHSLHFRSGMQMVPSCTQLLVHGVRQVCRCAREAPGWNGQMRDGGVYGFCSSEWMRKGWVRSYFLSCCWAQFTQYIRPGLKWSCVVSGTQLWSGLNVNQKITLNQNMNLHLGIPCKRQNGVF